jgi:hypothetical protein
MVIDGIRAQQTLNLLAAETLRCAQGDSTSPVILSEAKNLAVCHYLFDDRQAGEATSPG